VRELIDHSGMRTLRPLYRSVLELSSESLFYCFRVLDEGAFCFGSPEGPECYACFRAANPLD